ncbi:MAG: hypothetical protein ABJH05_17170 [Fulvivirga sp.]
MNRHCITIAFTLFIICFKGNSQDRVTTIKVFNDYSIKKVKTWGYDLKQDGKTSKINEEAAELLFVNYGFNLVRIPLYPWLHGYNGEIEEYRKYDAIVQSLQTIIANCKSNGVDPPDIYISPKIGAEPPFEDWGPFLNDDGVVDIHRYFLAIERLVDYLTQKLELNISYLALTCEKTINQLPPELFNKLKVLVQKKYKNMKLVAGEGVAVGPVDLSNGINRSVEYWPRINQRKTILSTHNKNNRWSIDAMDVTCDWNGESIGPANLLDHFIEMNQSFYIGEVSGVVFWGDGFIDSEGLGSEFRKDLMNYKNYRLLKTSHSNKNSKSSVIAYKVTSNKVLILTASKDRYYIKFNRPISNAPKFARIVDNFTVEINIDGNLAYNKGIFVFR